MSDGKIRIVSFVITIASIALTLLSDYISQKKLDNILDEKIKKAVANINK